MPQIISRGIKKNNVKQITALIYKGIFLKKTFDQLIKCLNLFVMKIILWYN
tara:strand:- start:39 stop:191 length:153 start_codon:yes stop_codon:yes gene_type:complete